MAEYIRRKLAVDPIDKIRMDLGLPSIMEGHLADETTMVRLNAKGDAIQVLSEMDQVLSSVEDEPDVQDQQEEVSQERPDSDDHATSEADEEDGE